MAYIIKFVKDIENVDLDIFERTLIREGDVEKIIAFIKGVPSCNILKMIKAVIVFGTDNQINSFFLYIKIMKSFNFFSV